MNNIQFKDGDLLKYTKFYECEPNAKLMLGETYQVKTEACSIDKEIQYYLIDSLGKKLFYPYKMFELQIWFTPVTI
jgi:hypothetical protein